MYASQVSKFSQRTCVCRQQASLSHTGLTRLLRHTAKHAQRIQLPELYKIGILLKDPADVLRLRDDGELIKSLAQRYQDLRGHATPFQVSLLDGVLPSPTPSVSLATAATQSGSDGTLTPPPSEAATNASAPVAAAAPTASTSTTARDYYTAIMDLVKEVEAEHGRATAREARQKAKAHSNNSSHDSRKSHNKEREGQEWEASSVAPSSVPSLGVALGSMRAASLDAYLSALEPLLRQLSPTETVRLVKTLAKLNYTNYQHTALLTRRGCEVANQLQRHDLCTLFFNLHKLHTRDSCVPIVNRILDHVQELTAEEVFLLCQSFERQENNSTASQRLLTPLVAQAVKKLPDATSAVYHRMLLLSMARYHLQQPATVQLVLRDWAARWKTTSSEKDVLVLLEAATTLAVPGTEPEGMKELIDRLTLLAPTMDLWLVDRVMDLLSTVPMHRSNDCMHILLTRLENEAGRLTVAQLKFVLHLLSTYPPAKGQVAIVSLAYACALRAKSMDAETLESIVISLAMLQLFTDDFFSIALVLQTQKGGIRSFEQVQVLLGCCTPEMAALPQGLGMLSNVICTLAPTLKDEELSYCRKALVKLGVTDHKVLQQIFTKAKRLQRAPATTSSSRKRRSAYYDPMADLL